MKALNNYVEEINILQKDIEKYLKEDMEKEILKGVIDILYVDNVLKINFFGLGIRELIRIFLSNNSNDNEIKKCVWYQDYIVYDSKSKEEIVTRKQRMIYSIYGGLDLNNVKQILNIDVEDKIKQLVKKEDKLNEYTHINNIIKNNNDVMEEAIKILKVFKEFLEKLFNFREELSYRYEKFISEIIIDKFANEFIEEFDRLSTHYENPYFCSDEIKIKSIDSNNICLFVTGSTDVTLQFGSDYDNRVGDGFRWNENHITKFTVTLAVEEAFNEKFHSFNIENFEILDDNSN